MRSIAFVVALAACHGSHGSTSLDSPSSSVAPQPDRSRGLAVVELFTSEGCNSCPPADAALADLVKRGDARVFPIAFHVDYWDALGWPDRFADARFTSRQRAYATAFGASSVFTPQMIVNGATSMNGADHASADAAIARALATTTSTALAIAVETRGASVVVRWRVDGPGARLVVAIVEGAIVSRVKRGENAGRTLHHENVARAFATTAIDAAEGTTTLALPSDVERAHAEIVAFVQNESDGARPIVAAARAALPR